MDNNEVPQRAVYPNFDNTADLFVSKLYSSHITCTPLKIHPLLWFVPDACGVHAVQRLKGHHKRVAADIGAVHQLQQRKA